MPIFDGINLLITLEASDASLNVARELYSEWKEWVSTSDNAKFPPAFRASGGDALTPGIDAGAYYFLRNDLGWRIRPAEEDLTVVVTGNLFGESSTLPIIIPTLGEYTVMLSGLQPITQSVSKLLLQQQDASYNGSVVIDPLNGAAGTSYPTGTASEPVSTFTDAKIIADTLGVSEYVISHGTLNLTEDLTFAHIRGSGSARLNFMGYDVSGSRFENLTLEGNIGTLTAPLEIRNSTISNVTGLVGNLINVDFTGNTVLSEIGPNAEYPLGLWQTNVRIAASAISGSEFPIIDLNNMRTNLSLRQYSGGMCIINSANDQNEVSIDLVSGTVDLPSSVSEGIYVIRGVGILKNNTGPNVVVADKGLLQPEGLARSSDFFKYGS